MQENNGDTKTSIFNISLRMFAENGYENVSVRDIAEAVGIKAASIYNHYESKEKILDACYDFYLKNRNTFRLNREQYEPVIRNGTKEEVLNLFSYIFDTSIHENMGYAVFVIYSRVFSDARAREIYAGEMNDSIQYLQEVFSFGITIGRFNSFNIQAVSLVILSTRVFTAHSTSIQPEQKIEWYKAQADFSDELIKIVPFNY